MKITLIFICIFLNFLQTNAQFKIKGSVLSEKSAIPGVSIIEKGTTNGTVTDEYGKFALTVSDSNAILVFSAVGFITKEYALNGKGLIVLEMKSDCIIDFFDTQSFTFYLQSGLIHNPIGGHIDIAFPAFSKGTLITGFGYQTNLKQNHLVNVKAEYKHFIWTCDFDIDANWYYRNISFEKVFTSNTNSIEFNFNRNKIGLTTGYSLLNFSNFRSEHKQILSGFVIGLNSGINTRLIYFLLKGKTVFYKGKIEYIGKISFYTKLAEFFVNFYKLDSFSELSIGIGKRFGYLLKSQRK